jgi:ribosome biogenesis protein NSA1
LIVGNTIGEMEMIDLRASSDKNSKANSLKKYKSFQGTIKSMQIFNNHVATCGLDRFLRVHNVETSQLVSKVYLKSRLNCLLFSKHQPIKQNSTDTKKVKAEVDDDQLSNINSEDLGMHY